MRNSIFQLFLVVVILSAVGCKSEFEKVRISGDPERILKTADKFYGEKEYQQAQGLYELVIPAYRGKRELEDIYFNYAYTFYYTNKFVLASYYFNNFSTTFASSKKREEADFMNAYSNYEMSPTYRLEQGASEKAVEAFQLFVNTYPNSEKVEQCNRLIDELRLKMEFKALAAADLYYDLRQYQAAVQVYENLLKDFPETSKAEEIRFKIVKATYLLAENSVKDKREERFNISRKYAESFLSKYEKSKFRKEVRDYLNNSVKQIKTIANG